MLHLLVVAGITSFQELMSRLREDQLDKIFIAVHAGQHRAKLRHYFREFEAELSKNPDLHDHYLQVAMKQMGFDPGNLPKYSTSPWLNTTTAMIAVGLPPGVCS